MHRRPPPPSLHLTMLLFHVHLSPLLPSAHHRHHTLQASSSIPCLLGSEAGTASWQPPGQPTLSVPYLLHLPLLSSRSWLAYGCNRSPPLPSVSRAGNPPSRQHLCSLLPTLQPPWANRPASTGPHYILPQILTATHGPAQCCQTDFSSTKAISNLAVHYCTALLFLALRHFTI